ncbi:MAG: helix-turn-helix transcriptional regulator, partial [Treponema sp.]|nr:helix-turn-helix transcriptional regulator [Treponema sp.]
MPEHLFHNNLPITPGNQIHLERPRIDRLLEQAIPKRVIIICAGAGYGKTSAAYFFIRKLKILTCWMQFSSRDNNGDRFWENFITAVT